MSAALLTAMVLDPVSAPRALADDASDGQSLARQWCSSCHTIGRETQQVVNGAPAFAFMARNAEYTPERLEGWLLMPRHPAMQGIDLSRTQIRQIRAYIDSLKI